MESFVVLDREEVEKLLLSAAIGSVFYRPSSKAGRLAKSYVGADGGFCHELVSLEGFMKLLQAAEDWEIGEALEALVNDRLWKLKFRTEAAAPTDPALLGLQGWLAEDEDDSTPYHWTRHRIAPTLAEMRKLPNYLSILPLELVCLLQEYFNALQPLEAFHQRYHADGHLPAVATSLFFTSNLTSLEVLRLHGDPMNRRHLKLFLDNVSNLPRLRTLKVSLEDSATHILCDYFKTARATLRTLDIDIQVTPLASPSGSVLDVVRSISSNSSLCLKSLTVYGPGSEFVPVSLSTLLARGLEKIRVKGPSLFFLEICSRLLSSGKLRVVEGKLFGADYSQLAEVLRQNRSLEKLILERITTPQSLPFSSPQAFQCDEVALFLGRNHSWKRLQLPVLEAALEKLKDKLMELKLRYDFRPEAAPVMMLTIYRYR